MLDPMAAIRETFFQECEDLLAELETGLSGIGDGTADAGTVNAVFRAVHSIKGSAGIFALDALVGFAHRFETVLDALRGGGLAPRPEVMKTLLQAADALADLIRAARSGESADEVKTRTVEAALTALLAGAAPPMAEPQTAPPETKPPPDRPKKAWRVRLRPSAALYLKGNETSRLLRELGRLSEAYRVTLDASRLPDLTELDPEGAYLEWTVWLEGDLYEYAIREVFEFVEDDCELEIVRVDAAAIEADQAAFPSAVHAAAEEAAPAFGLFPPLDEPPAFEIYDIPAPPQDDVAAAPAPKPAAAAGHPAPGPLEAGVAKTELAPVSATIRVELDRVDRLIDLVGELVINEAMLSQRVFEAGLVRASGVGVALEELEQLTREIQDSVMAIRAQPVRAVFQRMKRLVREVAAQTGKQVRLVTEGEGTEVDKTVIERIADPLTHMIRNAIDHGLEAPAARRAAGKPEEGLVRLTALHRSGRIVLEVSDDGGGINRPFVRAKAVQNNLIAADAVLTDDEIDNLIFLPGFSTASAVSSISGRGVGMDVVRQSVQALGGHVSIASRPGAGATFTLSLPLTLAVLDGMVVRAAGQTLIIPLGAIIETLQPRPENVHRLDADLQVIALRGGFIPLIDVATSLGYRAHPVEPERAVALLVEGEHGARAVLLVDEIDAQRQVVIKSLETNYRAVPKIAAATVMGDGKVALILDIDQIVSATRAAERRAEPCLLEAS
jgi:two-component system chemotaxis sensor kinase CheA